jgi:N-succinyldiaminopimelate aminotransferase
MPQQSQFSAVNLPPIRYGHSEMSQYVAARARGFQSSIFSAMTRLALKLEAVNLGQGFPDFDGPSEIAAAGRAALENGPNQYAASMGLPELRQAIAAHARRFYQQSLDWQNQVLVTSGATEALFDAVLTLVEPGDEVVFFEPAYDSYRAAVQLAGGTVRSVALNPPDATHAGWWFDRHVLERSFSDRTKLLLLNTPHNPTGKVFTREELSFLLSTAEHFDALILCDEVYEHLVYTPHQHVRLATLPGAAERTLTASSAGKSFSFTGWKIGWLMGPSPLIEAVHNVHQWVTFCAPAPLQQATAMALQLDDPYFSQLVVDYQLKRDFLLQVLNEAGLKPMAPEGSYFIIADATAFAQPGESDLALCERLTKAAGVAAIPTSVFYVEPWRVEKHAHIRFAFCKRQAVLDEAARRLLAFAAQASR